MTEKWPSIGYVAFGKDDFGYGLAYLLDMHGIPARRATVQTAKFFDVLLVSCFWWQHVYDFVEFCVKAGVGNKRTAPIVIVGGFNSFNPWVFLPWAHKVVVGDGEDVVLDAIFDRHNPSIFTGKETSVEYANADICSNDFAYCTPTQGITRIEIARGCKYRCAFCQLSYLKPYREISFDAIASAIDKTRTKRVALFAPNGMTHSRYDDICNHAEKLNLSNIASDVRYNEIERFRSNNTARLGIEGLSYKLRKSIGKPLTQDALIEMIHKRMRACLENGFRPSIHTYYILDLPGEDQSDWEEFEDTLWRVNALPGSQGLTWIITGNVFMPGPHTRLENAEIHLLDYGPKWKHALADNWREKKFKFTLTGRHSVWSPYSRVLSMIATRGGEEASEIIFNVVKNKDLRSNSIGKWQKTLATLSGFLEKNYQGLSPYVEKPTVKPWSVVRLSSLSSEASDPPKTYPEAPVC